jgi:hypothetical protein
MLQTGLAHVWTGCVDTAHQLMLKYGVSVVGYGEYLTSTPLKMTLPNKDCLELVSMKETRTMKNKEVKGVPERLSASPL